MRVRFLIAQFHPRVGGAERQALLQARTLRQLGHDVVVHTLRYSAAWPKSETIDGVEVRRHAAVVLGGRLRLGHGLQWLTGLVVLLTLVRERKQYDVLHIHQLSWLALVGAIVAWLLHKPVLIKVGSTSAVPLERAPDVPLNSFAQSDTINFARAGGVQRWFLLRAAIDIVATTHRMADELGRLGWPAERVHVIPNGVEVHPLNRHPVPREVVTVARLSHEKGIDSLLDAWRDVQRIHPDAHLSIVGGGRLADTLRAQASRLELNRSVSFVGHVDDPRPYLDRAELFCLPSRYEGMPNALLEAMARGVPAVATRVSGSEELIEHGVSGVLVDPEDPPALARAVGVLLDDAPARARYADAARSRIERDFDIGNVMRRYVELYAARRPATNRFHPLIAAALLLMSATLATKVVGLLNQVVASSHFGAGAAMDAYFAVLAVPVFATNIVSATLTSAVTPEYVRRRTRLGPTAAANLFRSLLWSTLGLSLLVSAMLVGLGPLVVRATAPGLSADQLNAAERLVPFIYPLLAVNAATGVITGMVNAEGRFGPPAYAAALVPLTMIVATLLFGADLGVAALAGGMLVGSVGQLALTLVVAARSGLSCNPRRGLALDGIGAVARSAAPLALGVVIVQLSPVIDQIVASWLPVGSLSAINYSLKIVDIPVVVLFMTASRVLLPRFSNQASRGNLAALEGTLRGSIRVLAACVIPVSLVFIVFSTPIVRLFYQRGAFDEDAVRMTAGCLIAFSIGLLPMGIGFILPKVFNAIGRNSVLAWFSVVTLLSNAVLDVVLAHFWQHVGIALSTSLTYTVVTVGMFVVARRMLRRDVRLSRALQYTTP